MATSSALVRLERLKDHLNHTGTAQDTDLKRVCASATTVFEGIVGRELIKSAKTEYYSGDASNRLWLRHSPASNLASVTFDALKDTTDAKTVADFVLMDDGLLYYQEGSYSVGFRNVKVVYDAGYDNTNWDAASEPSDSTWASGTHGVPMDMEEAVMEISAVMWDDQNKSGRGRLGLRSRGVQGESLSFENFAKGIPMKAMQIALKYRRPTLPVVGRITSGMDTLSWVSRP